MPNLKQPEPTPGAIEGVMDDTMLDEGAIEGATTDDRASDRSDRHCCLQTTTNQKDNVSLSPRPLAEVNFTKEDDTRSLLISAAHDKLPQIRSGENGELLVTLEGHRGAVWSAKIDAYTRTFAATASGDFTAKLWCSNTGNELHEFKHNHVVKSIDFSLDTLNIATGCLDGLLRVFDTCDPDAPSVDYRSSSSSAEGINKVMWSLLDRHLIVVGKKSGVVEQWDMRVSNTVAKPILTANTGTNHSIIDMEQNANNNLLMLASGSAVFAYTLDSLQLVRQFEMPAALSFKEEGGVTLRPDGAKFIAGGSDVWLREFDFYSGEELRVLKGHHGPIRCVRYNPGGTMVVSGSTDATIRFWDMEAGVDGY